MWHVVNKIQYNSILLIPIGLATDLIFKIHKSAITVRSKTKWLTVGFYYDIFNNFWLNKAYLTYQQIDKLWLLSFFRRCYPNALEFNC